MGWPSAAATGRGWTVAGKELGFVRQGEELLANSVDQEAEIAVGEITPSNPAEEDHVADQRQHRLMVAQQVNDVACRMAGNGEDMDVDPAGGKDLAVANRDVRAGG